MLERFGRPVHALVQGASGGMGFEFVRQLLEQPQVARVSATCRAPVAAVQLQELAQSKPDVLELFALDLTDEATISETASVLAEREPLDLVINASGVLWTDEIQPEKSLAQVRRDALETSFRINALGPLLVLKHLVPLMPRRERTVIASLSARVGSISDNRLGGWYAYRASKAALNMFHRTLSVELTRSHPGNICVVLHPGTVDTGLSGPFQSRVPEGKLFTPERSARQLLEVIDALEPEQTGSFLAWDKSPIDW